MKLDYFDDDALAAATAAGIEYADGVRAALATSEPSERGDLLGQATAQLKRLLANVNSDLRPSVAEDCNLDDFAKATLDGYRKRMAER
jgi:hypothetical protein